MAGDWIKIECTTPNKPEVWTIAQQLDLDPDAVLGKLARVWIWADSHTEDGHAPSVTKMIVDREVGVTGFCDALIDVGWLLDHGDTIEFPHFDRHNGKSAKKRVLAAERQRKRRAPNVTDEPDMSRSERDNSVTREEKRRDIGDSLRSSPSTIPAAPKSSAPVARFARSTDPPTKPSPSGYTQEFETFWKTYPRGDGKAPAFKAWKRLSAEDREAAAADVPIRAASHGQWLKDNGQFIPHAATYLNQRRWEDEIQPIAPGGDHEARQRHSSGSRPRAVDRVIATQQAKLARLGIGGGNG